MQKFTMLPEIPGVKSAVFTGRICCYNETFSPVRNNKEMKSISTVWHAGQMGRNDEDVTSAFVILLFSPHVRDKENIIIWLDNCSSQNKSWTLFHTMIKVFCSTQNVLLTLILKYFEAGHGFNACDSHHHLLENEFKKKKFLYHFSDYVACMESAGSCTVLQATDFIEWEKGVIRIKEEQRYTTIAEKRCGDPIQSW